MKDPELQPLPLHENASWEQHPSARLQLRQVACVLILLLTDVSAIAVCLKLAIFLRAYLIPHMGSRVTLVPVSFGHYLDMGWLWLLLVVFLGVEGLYTRRRSLWNEIGQLTKAIGLGLVAILAAVALRQLTPEVSRLTILLTGMNLFILLPVIRFWTKKTLGVVGLWRKRILILGVTDSAKLAIRGLTSDPVLGYEVAGILDDDPLKKGKCVGVYGRKQVLVLGSLSQVREQMQHTHTKDVLIAMPGLPGEKLLALVHEFQPYTESMYVVPQLWELPMMNLQVDGFLRERVMMLKLSNNLAKPWNSWWKRGFDLLVGAVVTLFALPVGFVLGVLIKLDSKGPALFFQERLGYRGSNFRCLKFRTMHVNGDQKLVQYLERNPHAADEMQKYAKLRIYDPRVTRVGSLLRRWSFDELPQLLNVLKGEMSLVGPRPYLPQERERIGMGLPTILSSRPGMTGLWQVNGRNNLTLEDRVHLEAWYVRNWTVWLDCIILAKTFRAVLFPLDGSETVDVPVPTAPPYNPAVRDVVPPAFGVEQRTSLHHGD